MRSLFHVGLLMALGFGACSPKKTTQTTTAPADSAQAVGVAQPLSPQDSIERAVAGYDERIDIKMRRKIYEPGPGVTVTLQQWWEYGDSTHLSKVREEVLTEGRRMQIVQYHFLNGQLAEIHTNDDNRRCDGQEKQCVTERKYLFRNGALLSASQRQANSGPNNSLPNLEAVSFVSYTPTKQELAGFMKQLTATNAKWQTLPYPKRRPERGSPVPPAYGQ
jgi:hypothetical protein